MLKRHPDFFFLTEWVKIRTRRELNDQGHRTTDKLFNSVELRVRIESNGNYVLEGWMEDYGVELDSGIPASAIPRQGALREKRLQDLERWIKKKGITTNKRIDRVALLIHRAHRREGVPTSGSFRFSRNGRRTGWFTYPLDNEQTQIVKLADQTFERHILELCQDIFMDVISSYPQIKQIA